MDPSVSVSSLQKTSPNTDPAAIQVLSHEVTTQAQVLSTHQQQLTHLTQLTDELVKSLQNLQAAATAQPTANYPPSPLVVAQPPMTSGVRLAFPDKFSGNPAKCKGFLLQCKLFIAQQPHLFKDENGKIAFVCSLLTGKALDWATAVWPDSTPIFPSFNDFLKRFCTVFDHPEGGRNAGEELLCIQQGDRSAAEFALQFRTLAAQTGWADDPLVTLYRRALKPELQREMACRDDGKTLDQLIELSIRLDTLLRTRNPLCSIASSPVSPETSAEPMQLGRTRLNPEERERQRKNHLCIYCGLPGHTKVLCPNKPLPRTLSVSATTMFTTTNNVVNLPVTLRNDGDEIETMAMIDSGAAGNFIDYTFATTHSIPLTSCDSSIAITAVDGRPLGEGRIKFQTLPILLQTGSLHEEEISLLAINSHKHSVILGLPWLQQHDPQVSWRTGEIIKWSNQCFTQCLHPVSPIQINTINKTEDSELQHVPDAYHDLTEAFNKQKATKLPPHRDNDCAIELLPGTTPPRGRIFPLSQPETEAMKKYISEELEKGFIRPSTSPASAGFFFVKKKDGSLRPCIDYRGLNEITVKYRYPLPLVPAALEQLRSAQYFTKLDLRSAYNLIHIRQGDEWKTGFSTIDGHYEYLVMPFGLANSPSVFQAFVNEIFRDMLNKRVIVYIGDILVYSNSLSEHIQHVRAVLKRLIKNQLYAKSSKC